MCWRKDAVKKNERLPFAKVPENLNWTRRADIEMAFGINESESCTHSPQRHDDSITVGLYFDPNCPLRCNMDRLRFGQKRLKLRYWTGRWPALRTMKYESEQRD
jgi:hypothetical protein